MRNRDDLLSLRKALKDGIVDMATSDHTPVDIEEKRVEYDNASYGTIGLETAFGVLNQIYDTSSAIEILTRGRERFGIDVPEIKKGMTASLTLFDPGYQYIFSEADIRSTSKNSTFKDQAMEGKVYGIYSSGQLII